jgi:hypothetical protein
MGEVVNLSLIPEVRYRHYLEKEYRERKHGKSPKLTNADKASIEQELQIARVPARGSPAPPAPEPVLSAAPVVVDAVEELEEDLKASRISE